MLGRRFDEALAHAMDLHRDQVRKGTDRNAGGEPVPPTPYVAHLLGVASLALEAGADEDEAIAALLHDAIEDQPNAGSTERGIAEMFGARRARDREGVHEGGSRAVAAGRGVEGATT
jgi:(p)ppGpp synthase/HD superfamily hydrolase